MEAPQPDDPAGSVVVVSTPEPETVPDPATYGAVLLGEAREEVDRADQKASILLAAAGVAIGAILGGMVSSTWSPASSQPWLGVWWVGVLFVLAGVLVLATAIYPRTRADRSTGRARHLFYFEDAASYESGDEIQAALEAGAGNPLGRVSHQLFHVSRIVRRKYRLIRWGIRSLVLGAACCLAAVVQPHL